MKTRQLVLCGMCAALTCVLAPLSIPAPGGVPVSLATFSIMLAGALLGPRWGTLSAFLYILLGLIGLPVFAGWNAGPGVLFGMTGGYILGYLFLAFFTGLFHDRLKGRAKGPGRTLAAACGMVLGTAILYAFGTAWFIRVTGMDLSASLAACVLPFLPGDLVKIIAVCLLAPQIDRALGRTGALSVA